MSTTVSSNTMLPMPTSTRDRVPADLQQLLVPIDQLTPYPGNPRRGNVAAVKASLKAHGQYKPIVASSRTKQVLAGNHTWRAAKQLRWTQIAVVWLDVDDDQAARVLLVDNKSGDDSGYDLDELTALLQALPDLDGTGWTDGDLAQLLADLADEPEKRTDPDDAPDVPVTARSKRGDLWLLGPHRLLVDDARDPAALARATAGQPVDLLLTDPPYGVAYRGGTGLTIVNDDLDEDALHQLLADSIGAAADLMRPGAAFYVFSPSGTLETVFRLAIAGSGLGLRQQLVWVKDSLVLGRADYHGRHETILYGWRPAAGEPTDPAYEPAHDTVLYGWKTGAGHTWEGDRRQSTVWECPRPRRSSEHPTMKPVALLEAAIGNSARPGAHVLDLYLGSGSTLIAAHGTRRLCSGLELDPRYADVICRRYEEHTGTLPVLDGHGPVTFLD